MLEEDKSIVKPKRIRTDQKKRNERYKFRYHNDQSYYKYKSDSAARRRQKAREYLESIRNSSTCSSCGDSEHPWRLDFHHIDPSQKKKKVSQCQSITSINEEMKKCVLLCANCHRDHHYYNDNKHKSIDKEEM